MRRKTLLAGLVLTLLAALSVGVVGAEGPVPKLALELPPEPSVGDTVTLRARLTDPEGNPIPGEEVTFTTDAEFLNVSETMELGTAITDGDGLASLAVMMRSDGERAITATFSGSESFAPAKATDAVQVAPGAQIFQQEAPFRVPGANIILVAVVLATIWSAYFGAMVMLYFVSRAGATKDRVAGVADQ